MENQNQFSKVFLKKTRKGKVIKIVREKYLREDVEFGYLFGKCLLQEDLIDLVRSAPHKHLLVLDTNIAIDQIDLLEYQCPSTSFVVVLQTVLQEIQHLNASIYRRISALLQDESKSYIFFPNELSQNTSILRNPKETMNDYNDRMIRKSVSFFHKALIADDIEMMAILLTNDRANMKLAIDSGIPSFNMQSYMMKYLADFPELLDLVAAHEESTMTGHEAHANDGVSHPGHLFYPHLPMDDLLRGIKNKIFHKGVLRSCGDNQPGQHYVVINGGSKKKAEGRMSVTITGLRNANRALDGDLVAVEIITEGSDDKRANDGGIIDDLCAVSLSSSTIIAEPTAAPTPSAMEGLEVNSSVTPEKNEKFGRVVGIIRRNWRQYAGSLIPYEKNSSDSSKHSEVNQSENASKVIDESSALLSQALFIAVDTKIPPVRITTRRLDELLNQRVLVAIDLWPIDSEYPMGHYIRSLGEDGNKEVETQVLLHEFGVPCEAFSTEVMACLPSKDWKITSDIISQRTDLRHIPVVSIDPPGCKDIDDALHCVRLPNGNYEVGVHIADVGFFVEQGSPLDKEAAHRSTSTYLVQRRLDMLPGLLTTELCSLRSNEDHLAFSVIWEMDENANIIDANFCKSCIHSVSSMTYDEAQAILDSDCPAETAEENYNTSTKVELSVHFLNKIAKILRQNRIDNGALTLASPEVRFKFEGESDNPTDVSVYNIKESNQLVEEFMLLANITVSKKVLRHFPTLGVLRRHQPPSQEQFRPLLSAAAAVGVTLDISTSKTLADSLDNAVRPEDPYFNKLLRILSTRCMMPAQYFCSGEVPKDQWHHYGLAAPVYTHFTSPIRRYADLVVHRLLAAAIGVHSLPVSYADRSKQQDLCSHMNRRHRAAQHIQRASCGLHTILYFNSRPSTETAYVLSVLPDRILVIVPKFGVESTLMVSDIISEYFKKELEQSNCDASDMVMFDSVAHRLSLMVPDCKRVLHEFQVFEQVLVHISVQATTGTTMGSTRKIVMKLLLNNDISTSSGLRNESKKRGRESVMRNITSKIFANGKKKSKNKKVKR